MLLIFDLDFILAFSLKKVPQFFIGFYIAQRQQFYINV